MKNKVLVGTNVAIAAGSVDLSVNMKEIIDNRNFNDSLMSEAFRGLSSEESVYFMNNPDSQQELYSQFKPDNLVDLNMQQINSIVSDTKDSFEAVNGNLGNVLESASSLFNTLIDNVANFASSLKESLVSMWGNGAGHLVDNVVSNIQNTDVAIASAVVGIGVAAFYMFNKNSDNSVGYDVGKEKDNSAGSVEYSRPKM